MGTLERAMDLGNRIDDLMMRAQSLCQSRRDSVDRVLTFLHDAIAFRQGQNDTQSLVFNVPKGNDFEAVCLMAFPELRNISLDETTDGPSDLTYRPATWVGTGTGADPATSVDAMFELTAAGADGEEPRAYQNVGFPAQQLFSSPININQLMTSFNSERAYYSRNQYPSGLIFDPYWLLRQGTALTVQVTPTYSGLRGDDVNTNLVFEYRIRGVLAGMKKVQR